MVSTEVWGSNGGRRTDHSIYNPLLTVKSMGSWLFSLYPSGLDSQAINSYQIRTFGCHFYCDNLTGHIGGKIQ